MAHRARTPHVGSSLSCVDLLVGLHCAVMRDDDRFILSKGHGAMALYAMLAELGRIPESMLEEYARDGGKLAEHPAPGCAPGIDVATGSLGHGLSIGAGLSMAAKMRHVPRRVFVLLSDGECYEGSVWEAAIFAAANRLDNLIAIVDYNKLSAMSRTAPALEPLAGKWRAFGWEVSEIDGHDPDALAAVQPGRDRPVAVIAHTVKGKGVSFMEDDLEWHYRPPNDEDLQRALGELGA
jgi:transketolase